MTNTKSHFAAIFSLLFACSLCVATLAQNVSVPTEDVLVSGQPKTTGGISQLEGIKVVNFSNILLGNAEFIGLSKDQSEQSLQILNEGHRKESANIIRLSFPELDPNDPDALEKVKALGLTDSEFQRRTGLREIYLTNMGHQIQKDAMESIIPILTSDQRKRFRESIIFTAMTGMTWSEIFAGAANYEGLNLSEQEKSRLAEAAKRVRKRMVEEMMRIHKEAWIDLLAEFPPEERRKIEEYLFLSKLD